MKLLGLGTIGVATALVAGAVFVATVPGGSVKAGKELVFPIATWGSPSHINIVEFVGALEAELQRGESEGIEVRHYPAGQLAEDADMPVAVPTGKVKFGWITISGWSGLIPDVKIADAPTGLTMAQMEAATDGESGLKQVLNQRFEAKGAKLLAVTDLGPPVIVSRDKTVEPDDLKGKKVRVYSEGTAELALELGAAPVKLPFADVYTAMERGTIDAAFIGFQGVQSQRMYEVAQHLLIPASFLGTALQGWVANRDWWQGLDAAKKETLEEAIRAAELQTRKAIVVDRSGLAEQYRGKGMEVVSLAPGMPAYDQWAEATAPLMRRAEENLSPAIVAPVKKQIDVYQATSPSQ